MYSWKKTNARDFLCESLKFSIKPVLSRPGRRFGTLSSRGIILSIDSTSRLRVQKELVTLHETKAQTWASDVRVADLMSVPASRNSQMFWKNASCFWRLRSFAIAISGVFCLTGSAPGLLANASQHVSVGPGLVQELAASLTEVHQALDEQLLEDTIHGTYIYEKERTLKGAKQVPSTPIFEPWKGEGQAFYKVRTDAIAPRHFLDTADQGTIAVRYIVTSVNENRTRLRIDAVFVENSRRTVHPSDGTVEAAEFKVFQERLQSIQLDEQEALDTKRRRDSVELARHTLALQHEDESTRLSAAESSNQDLEQHVHSLRQQLERRIKAPGADLKSAPFRSAANVASLSAYADVVIVIVTPRWFGVETPDGQRGWLPVDQLESLP
jgi:hypothetical protein